LATLTQKQRSFLEENGISIGSVFDATGLGPKEYHAEMDALGKSVAIGVTECARGGHSMRTRAGHCVFCNPTALAFQERWTQQAFVYLAGSLTLKVVKVGFATHVENRITSLNSLHYAGGTDWVLLYWAETKNAGRHEYETHKILSAYASPRTYTREGRKIDCLETFACDAPRALEALRKTVSTISKEWVDEEAINAYLFESVTGGSFVRKTGVRKVESAVPLNRSLPSNRCAEKTNTTAIKPNSVQGIQHSSSSDISLIDSAENGDIEAQYTLGEIYLDGLESGGAQLQQDYAKALKWCRRAAENNHATAQYQLATMYKEGKGVQTDLQEAYAWATIAMTGYEPSSIELRNRLEVLLIKTNKLAAALTRAAKLLEEIQLKHLGKATQDNESTQGGALFPGSSRDNFNGFTAVCPECGKLNRIRAVDANRRPICGHQDCRASLVGN
jgi:hypothetical protein